MTNIKKIILFPIYFCSIAFLPLGEAKPVFAQQPSCQETLNSVLRDIRNRGTTVRYEIRRDEYQAYLISRLKNTRRINSIMISLNSSMNANRPSSIASNIISSPVLLKSYANRIFQYCGGTGIVNFGYEGTDWVIKFGARDDGMLGVEECHGSRAQLTRTISQSYEDVGYYCAFVIPDF